MRSPTPSRSVLLDRLYHAVAYQRAVETILQQAKRRTERAWKAVNKRDWREEKGKK